jgi:pantoate--beta-alanine ligase
MQVIDTIDAWRKTLDDQRAAGRSVGLVPTMGALHQGHAALIRRAAADNDVVGVTVFVNPLQFGPTEDLSAYPRTLPSDIELATSCGAAYVFAPNAAEMYPTGRPATTVHLEELTTRWEGESRPGHFDGVATVVTKLLTQAGACRAYFGEKDYQQLCVIRRLVADLDLPVEVVGCPTVREADGLALSSRNVYLTPEERRLAPNLHRALEAGAATWRRGGDPAEARRVIFSEAVGLDVIYAEVVDADTLEPMTGPTGPVRLITAARLGRTRLIDNMGVC